MHSYGSLPVSLKYFQEDETHIEMSTRRDLFHFFNEASFVWGWQADDADGGSTTKQDTFLFSTVWKV